MQQQKHLKDKVKQNSVPTAILSTSKILDKRTKYTSVMNDNIRDNDG